MDPRNRLKIGFKSLHNKGMKGFEEIYRKRIATAFLNGGFELHTPFIMREPHEGLHIGSPFNLEPGVGQELDL